MSRTQHTILLVDDEPQVLKGLKRHLSNQPYETVVTTDPKHAMELIVDGGIDLVVTDERMPGMRGTELLAESRRLKPEVVRMMLTGHADMNVIMNAVNMGEISRFFVKPCDPTELILGIHQGLQVHDLMVEGRRLLGAYQKKQAPEGQVERDATGAFLVQAPGTGDDIGSLLDDIRSELDGPQLG